MEVHHHAHTARKKWTHYLWEFLMLFLAVFCGFLAEYKLEQTIERHREKEFIISMLEDVSTDTTNINKVINYNAERMNYLDSLANACYEFRDHPEQHSRIYVMLRNTLYRPDLVYPTDRTIFQLKNAGGMRLIRKKESANSIIAYDNNGKQVLNQQVYYENYLTFLSESALILIDFRELWAKPRKESGNFSNVRLINKDELAIRKMGNLARIFQGIILQYNNRLQEMKTMAIRMSGMLAKEYRIH